MNDVQQKPIRSAMGWSASSVALAFWGARHHPDPAARASIAKALAGWARIKPDVLLSDDSQWSPPPFLALKSSPVEIEPSSVPDVAALSQLLFSKRMNGSRLRIASSDSLLGQYGLTVTDGGRAYASRRDLDRPPRRAQRSVAYLQPSQMSELPIRRMVAPDSPRAESTASIDAKGIIITVNGVQWSPEGPSQTWRLSQSSTVCETNGSQFSLTSVGLAATVKRTSIQLRPRSSEGSIKLMALMERRAKLVLVAEQEGTGIAPRAIVCLAPVDEHGASLFTIATQPVPAIDSWLRISWPGEPELPLAMRTLLARFLPVHNSWLDIELADKLLRNSSSAE